MNYIKKLHAYTFLSILFLMISGIFFSCNRTKVQESIEYEIIHLNNLKEKTIEFDPNIYEVGLEVYYPVFSLENLKTQEKINSYIEESVIGFAVNFSEHSNTELLVDLEEVYHSANQGLYDDGAYFFYGVTDDILISESIICIPIGASGYGAGAATTMLRYWSGWNFNRETGEVLEIEDILGKDYERVIHQLIFDNKLKEDQLISLNTETLLKLSLEELKGLRNFRITGEGFLLPVTGNEITSVPLNQKGEVLRFKIKDIEPYLKDGDMLKFD